jgi:hypothetical protein
MESSTITFKLFTMKKLMLLLVVFFSLSASAQYPPRLDTLKSGQIIFTDENGLKYETFISDGGKRCIIKDNKQIALFKREPKRFPKISDIAKSN